MAGPTGNVLLLYFVADESGSMAPFVDELNSGLRSLLDALQGEAMAAAKVRLAVIGFSDDAVCHLAPSDLRELEAMPKLTAKQSTSYTAAFTELYERIPRDIAALKRAGYIVHRPAVFFLTDGAPNPGDGWFTSAYADLVSRDFGPHPNVLAFGIGEADEKVIAQIATQDEYAFIAARGVDTGRAIAEFAKALTRTVIHTGQALASGKADLIVEKPEGFIAIRSDPV